MGAHHDTRSPPAGAVRPDWLEPAVRRLPIGIVVAGADRRVRFANAAASAIVGVEFREGRSLPADAARIRHRSGAPYTRDELPILRVLEHGDPVEAVFTWQAPDGSTRTVETSATPIFDAGGSVVAAVATFQDVSERERRERAEREFVTNAAHELQTPLTAITSAIEVLQAGAKDVPADRDRFLAHIQAESHRLARLAHALLLLARIETGVELLRREPVALRPLLDQTALAIRPAAGVEVRVQCPARLAASADRSLLEQALVNVAANAAKFTEAGSIVLTARRHGERVAVEVADTGRGLPPGDVHALFERFSREEPRDRGGFGLGLAIARQAVSALGGDISLASRPGRGTTVRILLPGAAA